MYEPHRGSQRYFRSKGNNSMIKKVGSCFYAHKSNLEEFLKQLNEEEQNRIEHILANVTHPYEILKYDKLTQNLSLIECDTWNILKEPIVGNSHLYKKDNSIKIIKGGKTVYHSKELFVQENYSGFSVDDAKQRTKEWSKIPNIKSFKNKIGNVSFWYQLLRENNLEI